MIIPYPFEATEYTAEDVQTYLCTRTSGVYSDEITFTPEGMTVTVSPFLAWFNYAKFKGCSVAVTEPETLTFSPAHAVLDRIDRIALRVDFTLNKAYLTIVEGEPSSTPTPPNINKSEVINDISPVCVRIKAGATEITPADITSTILDESVCGIMRDGVTGIPTAQLQAQVEDLLLRLHEEIDNVKQGSSYILKDGSVAFEGNVNAGNNRIINVSRPEGNADAVNKEYFEEKNTNITKKTITGTTNANGTISLGLYDDAYFVLSVKGSNYEVAVPYVGGTSGWRAVILDPSGFTLRKNASVELEVCYAAKE